MAGQFVQMGNKWGTVGYRESGDAMWELVDDFYNGKYRMAKSAGFAGYGDNGYFNAIMGKEITAAMFASDNMFTVIGARPYNHEGVRIAPEFADYGMSGENFVGIGAGTVQDGNIPDSVKMDVDELRQPYKDLPFAFNYGLGLMALENKDDTVAYKDYVTKMSKNYSDLLDKTLLRPLHYGQPNVGGIETSLNSLQRLVSSGTEIGSTEGATEITPGMVSPYGGVSGDFGNKRGYNSGESHVENNYDCNVQVAGSKAFNLAMVKKLWRTCSVNWQDSASPNNKVWAMSNIAVDAMSSQLFSQNLLMDNVYVQRSFNGVKTMPGRADAGMVLSAYNNVPIIIDGNLNFDYTKKKVSTIKFGDVMLLDLDHIWMSMLTPIEMFSVNNPAITRKLQEVNVLNMRAETRIDSFIQHGRITGISDDDGSATALKSTYEFTA